MKKKDFHNKPFDDATLQKLALFRDYLRAWLPVFIQFPVKRIQIYDFFAGPGCDANQIPGSPIIICDVVKNALPSMRNVVTPIRLYFNEPESQNYAMLCETMSQQKMSLPSHVEVLTEQKMFADAFESEYQSMEEKNVANLVFLDQFGTKEITQSIFQQLVSLPKTDFLFFIASSAINRFKENPNVRNNVPITDDDCQTMNRTNVHRILAQAYRRWLPDRKEKYYIAPFSLERGANVYGLIFCSGHPLGINKFLEVAWKHAGEEGAGEANFDIDDDRIEPAQEELFERIPNKVRQFEQELEAAILNRTLTTNRAIYEYTLEHGMLPVHSRNKIQKMIEKQQLPRQKQRITVSYDAWGASPIPILLKGD